MTLIVEGYIQLWVLQSCDKKEMPFHRFVCSTREITAAPARLTRVPFSFKDQASNSTYPGVSMSSPEKIFFSSWGLNCNAMPIAKAQRRVARQSVYLY